LVYSALLHDIGKIFVDIEVELFSGKRWYFWQDELREDYRFRYIEGREYQLHGSLGAFFCTKILSQATLNWLAQYQELFHYFLNTVTGHHEKSGILSELVQKADQLSVSANLGGDITKVTQSPKIAFSKQLLAALRYLVTHELILNNVDSGSDGWLTEDGLWLVSKTIADKIRAYL